MMTLFNRMKGRGWPVLVAWALAGCPEEIVTQSSQKDGGPTEAGVAANPAAQAAAANPAAQAAAAQAAAAQAAAAPREAAARLTALEQELVAKHGEPQRPRIKQGLAQVAALWRSEDGDLGEFARAQFQDDPAALQATFGRLEAALEQLDGHYNEITRELRRPSDVDTGPQWPVDALLSSMDAAAHALEDLFASKVAFVALLNFPQTSLEQRLGEGSRWTREQWAAARLTGRFVRRVPGPVQQRIAAAASAGERYINGYNLWMHHLLDPQGVRLFRKGLRLISQIGRAHV